MEKVANIVRIIYSPKEVFEKEENNPSPWLPFVFVLLISLLLVAIVIPVTHSSIVQAVKERVKELPPQARERSLEFLSLERSLIFGLLTTFFMVALKIFFQAGVLNLLVPLIGGEGTFNSVLTAVAYGNLISTYGGIVKLPAVIIKKSPRIHTDLSLFLPQEATGFFKYLLSNIDIFTIWSLLVMGAGLSVLCKVESKKAYIFLAVLWIIYIFAFSFLSAKGIFKFGEL